MKHLRHLFTLLLVLALAGQAFAAQFLSDTFTGTDTTLITSHTGELGATWTNNLGSGSTIVSNRATGTTQNLIYASGTPGSADYRVTGSIVFHTTIASGTAGVVGRFNTGTGDCYLLVHGSNVWTIYKRVSGTFTSLGTYNQTLTANQTYTAVLGLSGTTLTATIDNVVRITVTDATISAAGKAGIYTNGANSNAAGYQVDFISASDGINGSDSLSSVTTSTITVANTGYNVGVPPFTYQWYRSTSPGFTPGAGNIRAGATSLTFADSTGLSANTPYYYILVGTDSLGVASQSNQVAGQLLDTTLSIGAIGDSITAGFGLSAGQDPVTQTASYLTALGSVKTVISSNRGVAGLQTSDWTSTAGGSNYALAKAAWQGLARTPDYIHIMLGCNDAHFHVTAATYQSNLATLIANIQADFPTAKIVISYPLYVPSPDGSSYTDDAATLVNKQYQTSINNLVNGTTILLGDTVGYAYSMNNLSTFYQSDLRHPSVAGAVLLGMMWARPIDRNLNPGNIPDASDVRSGVVTGTTVGTLAVPITADVRLGVAVGSSVGTLAVPSVSDVRLGTAIGGSVGTLVVPTAAQVKNGVHFGASSALVGTYAGGIPRRPH